VVALPVTAQTPQSQPRRPRMQLLRENMKREGVICKRELGVIGDLLAAGVYGLGRELKGGSGMATLRRVDCQGEPLVMKFGPSGEVSTCLQKEFDILRSVEHQNIVRPWAWHECAIDAGFTMSYCGGATLRLLLKTTSPDPTTLRAHNIATQITTAVAYLHATPRKIVHRDLHAGNILIGDCASEQHEKVILVDFGSATRQDEAGNDEEDGLLTLQRNKSEIVSEDIINSLFAGECTLPHIMPPQNNPHGIGSAFGLDAFAVGLLIVGLLRWKDTMTANVYKELQLRRSWWAPAPLVGEEIASVVLGPLALDPSERLMVESALQRLPPPAAWFQSQYNGSEALYL